jgi:hypothetical protein
VRANPIPASVTLASSLALPLFLSGCLFPGEPESRGVKLSEAMTSSAKGDRQDLGGRSANETYTSDDTTSTTLTHDSDGSFLGVIFDKSEYAWQLPVEVRYSIPFSGEIQRFTHFTLTPLSHEDEHNYWGIYLGGAIVDLESGSLPDLGTESPWLLDAGISYRRYLNKSRTAFSPYVAASFGYQLLGWRYRNEIVVGGDTIKWDALHSLAGYAGFGVSTRRDSRVSFFAEVGAGGTAFLGTTLQGFDNDVFDCFGFYSFKVGMSLKF